MLSENLRRPVPLFPAKWPMGIRRNRHLEINYKDNKQEPVLIGNEESYTESTRAEYTSQMNAWHTVSLFVDICATIYVIPIHWLTDIEMQFTSKTG